MIGVPSTGGRVVAAATAAGLTRERAVEADDLEQAVNVARELSVPGTVVLLSPAAPSFDHYRDFEQRGERFGELVRAHVEPSRVAIATGLRHARRARARIKKRRRPGEGAAARVVCLTRG